MDLISSIATDLISYLGLQLKRSNSEEVSDSSFSMPVHTSYCLSDVLIFSVLTLFENLFAHLLFICISHMTHVL